MFSLFDIDHTVSIQKLLYKLKINRFKVLFSICNKLMSTNMDKLFEEFRFDSGIDYPPFSQIYFEKYFYNFIQIFNNNIFKLQYIPVFWTELQISQDNQNKLQSSINRLNTEQCYRSKYYECPIVNGSYLQCTNNYIPKPDNFNAPCENRTFEMTAYPKKISENCYYTNTGFDKNKFKLKI